MSKLGLALSTMLLAGAVSATLEFTDTEWAAAIDAPGGHNEGSSITMPGSDIAGDPGYEWQVTINPDPGITWFDGEPGGYVHLTVEGLNYATSTVWEVTVENTGSHAMWIQQVGALTDAVGGDSAYKQSGGQVKLAPGGSQTLVWDVAIKGAFMDSLSLMIGGNEVEGTNLSFKVTPAPLPPTELVLYDPELQTIEANSGGRIDAVTDIDGNPGMQVDARIDTSAGGNYMFLQVPMGGTTNYSDLIWTIQVANTNAHRLFVRQLVAAGSTWAWDFGDSVGVWMNPGQTNTFTMTLPSDVLHRAMIELRVDLAEVPVVNDEAVAAFQVVGPRPPDKTPMELYLEWAAGYGLTDTNTTAAMDYDVEPDGMDNLLEYALGGNPAVDDATTIQPVDTFLDGDTWEYIYKRYRDAAYRQLTYDLQTTGDLIGGSWVSSGGMYETGTNTTDATFDVVTNTISGLADGMFIKLEVTENF